VAVRTTIGLDIGTSGVRAAELAFGKNGVTLEKFGQVALPDGAVREGEVADAGVVAAMIRQLWSHTGFTHKNVVMGVASPRVIVRSVDLPWLPAEELKRSLPLHVQDYLPMPVDQAVLDFHPLVEEDGPEGRRVRGLLVGAAREMVLGNVRAVQMAGLRPTMVDLTSFAVLRSVGSAGLVDSTAEAIIDIGSRVTNIVVHSGGVPQFVRILLLGGQDVTDAVADRLGVAGSQAETYKQNLDRELGLDHQQALDLGRAVETSASAFVEEIRGSLDYFASTNPGGRVERVLVSGGGSQLEGVAERLAAATRLPVEIGNPLRSVKIGKTGLSDDQLAFIQPLAAVPVGLALGAAS
jgi:type IV pilus assembly protein PilM